MRNTWWKSPSISSILELFSGFILLNHSVREWWMDCKVFVREADMGMGTIKQWIGTNWWKSIAHNFEICIFKSQIVHKENVFMRCYTIQPAEVNVTPAITILLTCAAAEGTSHTLNNTCICIHGRTPRVKCFTLQCLPEWGMHVA